MCRDVQHIHKMNISLEHIDGGGMGSLFSRPPAHPTVDGMENILTHSSEDEISDSGDECYNTSADPDGMVEPEMIADADEQMTDEGITADMDINDFYALLFERPKDNNVETPGNMLHNHFSPAVVVGEQGDLLIGQDSGHSQTLGMAVGSRFATSEALRGESFSSGGRSNMSQELGLMSFGSSDRLIDHNRPKQPDDSVLASDWEQGLTSSLSKFENEPAGDLSPCSDVVQFRKDGMAASEDDTCVMVMSYPGSSSVQAVHGRDTKSQPAVSYGIVDLTEIESSDDDELSDQMEVGSSALGKRKLPAWIDSGAKRHRVTSPWLAQKFDGQDKSEFQLVDLSRVKSEAPAPQAWNIAKPVASLPTDLLNKQIAAAGLYARHPAITNWPDVKVLDLPGHTRKRLTTQVQPYSKDLSARVTIPPSGIAPIPPSGIARNISRTFPGQNVNSVVSRGKNFAESATSDESCLDEGLMTVQLLKHQRIALNWMTKREAPSEHFPVGGILADDQGLGKTISMISLILKNRPPPRKVDSENSHPLQLEPPTVHIEDEEESKGFPIRRAMKQFELLESIPNERCRVDDKTSNHGACVPAKGRPAAGTLVVCPTSVLRQWANELRTRVAPNAGLTFVIYHGGSRTRDPEELAKYDVVLTTYSILGLEVPLQPSPEEQEEEKRNYSDYGLNNSFFQAKAAKKADKGKKRSRGKGTEGQDGVAAHSNAGPLARVAWFRVILDEAQSIKNGKTQVARAAWGLRAKRRWCLSGTPIQNSIDDLYSYFRFLRYSPYDKYNEFRARIKDKITRFPAEGYRELQAILRGILLRRTKGTLIDGEPIVKLPPRIVELKQAEFTPDERAFYTRLEKESREQFQMYAAAGTVQNNYVNILWLLLRLRQACDHRQLVRGLSSQSRQRSTVDSVRTLPESTRRQLLALVEDNISICSICNDALEEAVVTSCSHVFCEQCIFQHLGAGDDTICPFSGCRKALKSSQLYSLAALNGQGTILDNSTLVKGQQLTLDSEAHQAWVSSSKIDAVISTLLALPKLQVPDKTVGILPDIVGSEVSTQRGQLELKEGTTCPLVEVGKSYALTKHSVATEKAIVFSQWTSMLDLLETPLKEAGFCYRRLDGTMSVNARDRAVHEFNTVPEVNVIIMSLKAASLGLNMVSASHVLLMDIWWNPTTEDQAIDRAHRIGQTRPVKVSRFTVKNTIEDRILALQDNKRQIVASAFGETELTEQRTRLSESDLRYLFRA